MHVHMMTIPGIGFLLQQEDAAWHILSKLGMFQSFGNQLGLSMRDNI